MKKDSVVASELHVVASEQLEEEVKRELAEASSQERKSMSEILSSSEDESEDEEDSSD